MSKPQAAAQPQGHARPVRRARPDAALVLMLAIVLAMLVGSAVVGSLALSSRAAGSLQLSQQGDSGRARVARGADASTPLAQRGEVGAKGGHKKEKRRKQQRPKHSKKRAIGTTGGGGSGTTSGDVAKYRRCRGPTAGEVVPRLVSVRQWRSGRARAGESITLVTQLSLERWANGLEMLESQCTVWPDPLAAVVYAPTVGGQLAGGEEHPELAGQPIEAAAALVGAFHARVEAEGACALDLELATQDFEDAEAAGLYPFNAARNRALMLAQTEVLLLLDADFVPAPALAAQVKAPGSYAKLMQRLSGPQAIVLPAFETAKNLTDGRQLGLKAVQRGKAFVVEQWRQGRLTQFAPHFPKGHGATDYQRWASLDVPYAIKHHPGYEPFILMSRQYTPLYDERFFGYGWDKVTFIMSLAGLDIGFSVHPSAYVVHLPHKKAATYFSTRESGHRDKLLALFREVNQDTRRRRFTPVVSPPERCGGDGSSNLQ